MCKLRDDTMSQAGELPMEKKMDEGFSRPLKDFSAAEVAPQSGTAVRGEAVAESGSTTIKCPTQGGFLVRVTPTHPEYTGVHLQLALEDALRVVPHGWPDGFQFEILDPQRNSNSREIDAIAVQSEDSAGLDSGCDCDSAKWCKNYNRCHRQVCGFPLRGALPKPV